MIRVLITGGRTFTDEDLMRRAFAKVISQHGPENVTIVHGACPRGADALADKIAVNWTGLTVERHPAVWDECTPDCMPGHRIRKHPGDIDHPGELPDYCPGAGPRRNAYMVMLGASICLAFPTPGSRGTHNCMKLARVAGIDVRRYPQ